MLTSQDCKSEISPRGDHRILYVSDPSSIANHFLPDPVRADDLRRWVDMLADSGVDIFNQEVYSQCWTEYWRSETIQYDQREQHKRFIPMLDENIQPLDVLIDQSHKRGMNFIAGFRVNDNHGYKTRGDGKFPWEGGGIAALIKAHPDWELTEFREGETYQTAYALDFTVEGVREFTAKVIREVIDRFDIDGVELCFRDYGYFPVNKGPQSAHLMTDLLRQVRGMLDEKEKSVNKKLLLGATVFSTIKENIALGLDTARWISEELINYLSPQDGMFSDFNIPFAEYSALTGKSNCMLFPALFPWTSQRARIRLKGAPLSSSTCRAYAHTCYRNGADGLSLYNHCTVTRTPPYYPQLMQVFHELRDPEKVASGERHYIFDPPWAGLTGFGIDCCSTGVVKAPKIVLDRSKENISEDYPLQLCESTDLLRSVNVLFRGFGLTEHDELEVRFNGQLIDDSAIGRSKRSDIPLDNWSDPRRSHGQSWTCVPEQRIDYGPEPKPPFSSRWFILDPAILIFGRNCLTVALTKSDPKASGEIVIDEVEVWIQP
jgi:hypothetical protein